MRRFIKLVLFWALVWPLSFAKKPLLNTKVAMVSLELDRVHKLFNRDSLSQFRQEVQYMSVECLYESPKFFDDERWHLWYRG
jgi:hypothetical protein